MRSPRGLIALAMVALTFAGSLLAEDKLPVTPLAPVYVTDKIDELTWFENLTGWGNISAVNVSYVDQPGLPASPGGAALVRSKGDTPAGSKNADQGDPCSKTRPGQSSTTAGDPVNFSTGNLTEPEVDFNSVGEVGVYLERTYNAYWDGTGIFGRYWVSNFDYKLSFTSADPNSSCYPRPGSSPSCDPAGHSIWADRPDGRKIKFDPAGTGVWNEDKALPIAHILKNGNGTYTLYSEDHTVETYDASGFPLTFFNEQGVGWTYTWTSNHYLTKVTHTSGRAVTFTWTGNVLTTVTDPAGNTYTYTYQVDKFGAGQHLLMSTAQPVPTTTTYQYEDSRFPGALTGKTINGTRYSWLSYDSSERAIETKHANGADDYQFSYGTAGDGSPTAIVTNPLGRKTTYTFGTQDTIVSGQASAHCAASYKETQSDTNGNPDLVEDFNGHVTDYDYNAKGQLLQTTEYADGPSSAQRITVNAWDTNNRLTDSTVLGYREVSYTYDGDGRVASIASKNLSSHGVANQTRTLTYTYAKYSSGLVQQLVIAGPVPGQSMTYDYSITGDLTSVTDALGHATTYAGYNGLGLPGSITGPNGDKHAYTYDARGRVMNDRTYRNGGTQDTEYEYDGFGRLSRVTQPDGQTHSYQYDVAGRLLSEYQPEPGGSFAQTVYGYNAMSLPTSIKTQRVFVEPPRGTTP